ncbi:hypothetical protein HK102_009339, partial [Quaeritorhiza haematococci]
PTHAQIPQHATIRSLLDHRKSSSPRGKPDYLPSTKRPQFRHFTAPFFFLGSHACTIRV